MMKTSDGVVLKNIMNRWTTVICSLSVLILPTLSFAECSGAGVQSVSVQSGDTLQSISQRLYGTSKKWEDIYRMNVDQLSDPGKLRAGMNLCVSETLAADNNVAVEVTGDVYIVQKGDTLTQISELVYGTFRKWKILFEMNQDQITNPDLIYIGMKLRTGTEDQNTNSRSLASEQPHREEPVVQEPAPVEATVEAEQQAREEAEAQAKVLAEQEKQAIAQAKEEEKARLRAEKQAREEAEVQARTLAEQEKQAIAQAKEEEKARLRAEKQARLEAETQARAQAKAEAKAQAELQKRAKQQAEADKAVARALARAEARAKKEAEKQAKLEAEAEERARSVDESNRKAASLPPPVKDEKKSTSKIDVDQKQKPAVQLKSYTDWEVSQ